MYVFHMYHRKKVHKKRKKYIIVIILLTSCNLNGLLIKVVLFSDFRSSIRLAQITYTSFPKPSIWNILNDFSTSICSGKEFHISGPDNEILFNELLFF